MVTMIFRGHLNEEKYSDGDITKTLTYNNFELNFDRENFNTVNGLQLSFTNQIS